jgi:hypothetical protein
MVERRDLLGHPHRIMCRHHVADCVRLEPLRMESDKEARHPRMVGLLETLDRQMMLVVTVSGVAEFVGTLNVGLHLVEIALKKFAALTRHPLLDLMATADCAGLYKVKFHVGCTSARFCRRIASASR